MSQVASIEHLGRHVGDVVTLRGWIYNKTSKGKLHFVQLRDGTGICQCVLFKKNVPEELFDAVGGAGSGIQSRVLTGEVKADERAPGGYEVSVVRRPACAAVGRGLPDQRRRNTGSTSS